jgi:integrase
VPLSARAQEILDAAAAIRDQYGEYVFPGRFQRGLSAMSFLMVLRRMRRTDITAHGFRSAFRDWVEERTHTPHRVAEAALAHTVKNKTERAYRRGDLFELRVPLMEAWAAHCARVRAKVVNIA